MEHPAFTVGDAIINNDILNNDILNNDMINPANIPPDHSINRQGAGSSFLHQQTPQFWKTIFWIADLELWQLITTVPNNRKSRVWGSKTRRDFTLLGKKLVCGVKVFAAWEQEPITENRIELSGEMDRLGVPRPILYWKKSNSDLKTVRTVSQLFGEHLAGAHIGRLRLRPWVVGEESYPENDELAGNHHMGGTRMSDTPDSRS
jgi:GMC oxidoreductase